MSDMQYRSSFAEINLMNLDHNLSVIMNKAGSQRFVCPMIKADAYGHGAVEVARRILKNYSVPVGVALIEEAIQLRKSGFKSEIIVFGGFDQAGAKTIIEAGLTPVVSQREQLEILSQLVSQPIDIHIKFNTGMNRLGFNTDEADFVFQFLKSHPRLQAKAVLSHLHSAYLADQENSSARKQAQALASIADRFKSFGVIAHLLNSDGIAALDQTAEFQKYPWGFRPGIMLYGYVASNSLQQQLTLKPVMSLKSRLQNIRKIKKGETVSYNATWTASKDSVIGVIPMGYADGVHRALSNRGYVYFQDRKLPICGKVCMDYTMVDLTEISLSSEGVNTKEVVEFFGPHQGADQLAQSAETISYEVLTSVSSRVPRRYIEAFS